MENRIEKCIACENRNFKYYADNVILRLPIYICQNCNLHVTGTSQIELDAVLSNYYKGDYWNVVREQGMNIEHTDSYSKGRIRIWTSQFKYVKKFISKKSKILEIGSGHGEAIIEFDKLNYNVIGIEPDKKNVLHLKQILKNCKIINSKADDFQIEEVFDLVWMSHVFEHLSAPIEFLKKIKKNISKNGILFIEVPNVEKKNDYRTFTKTPHAYNYTAKSLQNIIEKSGYEIISCDWFGPPSKVNGAINKLSKKLLNRDFYPYYPKMLTGKYSGEEIRVISQLKSKK